MKYEIRQLENGKYAVFLGDEIVSEEFYGMKKATEKLQELEAKAEVINNDKQD